MSVLLPSKDPLGQAVLDYLDSHMSKDIKVESDLAEDDVIPSGWLFRDHGAMPDMEKTALSLCRGRILDVGAGAGSHALWLQEKGMDVVALDLSSLCCQAMTSRGILHVMNKDILGVTGTWDTLLFLMNGLGIGGHWDGLGKLLAHCRNLLAPDGQIIFDSTDITALYEDDADPDDQDGGEEEFSGELTYTMSFQGCVGDPFPWIFLEPRTLEETAAKAGLKLQVLKNDSESGAWLGRLTRT